MTIRPRICGPIRRCSGIEPVAKLKSLIPEKSFVGLPYNPINPGTHALELVYQDRSITEMLIKDPGNDHRRVSPCRCPQCWTTDYIRNDRRDSALQLNLLGGEILEPGGEKPIGVIQEGCCWGKDLEVPGPTETLITLRAIGWDIEEIAAHTP